MEPAIRQKALFHLSRREHSYRELYQKLRIKGFTSGDVSVVLEELKNENLLNEDRFISCVIRSRRAKGFGPLKICAQLQKHGIDDDRIRMSDEWQEDLWQESAMAARIKRFGEAIPQRKNQRIQQARFLQQRGFTSSHIRNALLSNYLGEI